MYIHSNYTESFAAVVEPTAKSNESCQLGHDILGGLELSFAYIDGSFTTCKRIAEDIVWKDGLVRGKKEV